MPSPVTQIRTPPEMKVKLEELSASSGISVSEIVRACVTRALPYIESKIQQVNPATPGKDSPNEEEGHQAATY